MAVARRRESAAGRPLTRPPSEEPPVRIIPLLAWGWLAALGPAAADEPKPPPPPADAPKPPPKPTLPPGTPAEQVKALIGQFDAAAAEFRKRFDAAKTDEEQEKLLVLFPDPNDYAALLAEVAEKHPNDPAAFDAWLWAVKNGRPLPGGKEGAFAKAKRILARDYLMDPRVGPITRALWIDEFDPATVGTLRDMMAKNPSKSVQAQAAFTLARVLHRRAGFAEFFRTKATPEQVASWEKAYGKEAVADLKRSDPAALRKEHEELLERILADKDYAATVKDRGEAKVTLGELAERELFALRHLQPGKPAPEIEGEDIDGVKFKLSDYRGKVVLLDFWGHW
jgi:hypothetical protein